MRIAILASTRLLGDCLEASLCGSSHLDVACVVLDLPSLRARCAEHAPGLALIDVAAGADLDEIRALAVESPALRLVALGLAEQRTEVVRWAKAGFTAYVPRDTPLAELEPLLLEAAQGRSRCPGEIVAGL